MEIQNRFSPRRVQVWGTRFSAANAELPVLLTLTTKNAMKRLETLEGVRVKRNSLRKRMLYPTDNADISFPRGQRMRG